jgi:hypothetical protein
MEKLKNFVGAACVGALIATGCGGRQAVKQEPIFAEPTVYEDENEEDLDCSGYLDLGY